MSARSSLRSLVLELFPWMARFGLTEKGDLEIKSSSTKIELAGGDAAVHRVGDLGDGGRFTVLAANILKWTGPDGSSWTLTFASSSPISISVTPIDGVAGKIVAKATTGSEKVRSG